MLYLICTYANSFEHIESFFHLEINLYRIVIWSYAYQSVLITNASKQQTYLFVRFR